MENEASIGVRKIDSFSTVVRRVAVFFNIRKKFQTGFFVEVATGQ